MQCNTYRRSRICLREDYTAERLRDRILHLLDPFVCATAFPPLHAAEARDADFYFNRCRGVLFSSAAAASALSRAMYCADDFGVAHFEVAAAVGGGLCRHLGAEAAEFVPAPAIGAEVGEGVGGGVERHFGEGMREFLGMVEIKM